MDKRIGSLLVAAVFATSALVIASGNTANAATSPKTLVTCDNVKTGAHRILTKGVCNLASEKKVTWSKTSTAKTGSIILCTKKSTGASRVVAKGSCLSTEVKSIWNKKSSVITPAVLTCAQGGKCAKKDTGPGGGMVFYVADSAQAWGNYLEVAPKTWQGSSDPSAPFCTLADTNIATAYEIGDGLANSATLSGACTSTAAKLAIAYRGGGKSDWYLPSYKEIRELHGFIYGQDIPGFSPDFYWSSSQDGLTTGWAESFGNQGSIVATKATLYLVRPIRRF